MRAFLKTYLSATALAATGRRFAGDQRGNFAAIFGVTSLALLTAAGMALDYSRLSSGKARLNHALDAAVLSTTRDITSGKVQPEDAEELVRKFVLANIDEGDFPGDPVQIDQVIVDPVEKTLEVVASLRVPMTLSKLFSDDYQTVSTGSKGQFSNTKIEVSMALDITGSMGGSLSGSSETKIEALKAAATNAVSLMMAAPGADDRVRIGLVPYAATVDASPVIDEINYTGTSNGCVYERTGPKRFTDDFATPSYPVGGTTSCPGAQIVPMTNDETLLTNRINGFGTGGCTAGHIAIAWSYYMLSPNWDPAWPADSEAAPYAPGTRKYAIIMTDGIFNRHQSSGSGCDKEKPSRKYARKLCKNMKAQGIQIYTIAFAAPSNAAALMQKCASPDTAETQYFFDADNSAELDAAFEAIAKDITGVTLVN
ncbi:MAG: pilus assembly protein [Roseitalea sp.]|nr:pilus assembly protein [Roseitalea sp.]MBO6723640.1 pilus assembly protein [Roseitalea sp.]MBO6744155.1 pilus assembly protein [Roseitalea sp.]